MSKEVRLRGERLAKLIKAQRNKKGLTQEDLAEGDVQAAVESLRAGLEALDPKRTRT